MDIMETLIDHGLLESLWISTFFSMPLVREALFTGKVLYELFNENDEDENDEDENDDIYD